MYSDIIPPLAGQTNARKQKYIATIKQTAKRPIKIQLINFFIFSTPIKDTLSV